MPYRPPSRPPKGAWARHLHEERKARDLSQTQAFELVYERIGWSAKSRTAYVAIDMGDRQPKDNEIPVLGEEFGWPSAVEEEPDLNAVEAMSALADAIRALASTVQTDREEAAATREAMMTALGDIASRLEPRGTRASAGHGRRADDQ